MGISDPPGIYKPEEPIKVTMEKHKYLKWYSPAFSRGKQTEEGQLANDTVINYLNEIMKFLPRGFTDALTDHAENSETLNNPSDKKDWAESIYNTDIQRDINGLWKGSQSSLQGKIFGDTIEVNVTGDAIDSGNFTGLAGVPFDGSTTIGTWDKRKLSVTSDRNDADTEWDGALAYDDKNGEERKYVLNKAEVAHGKVVPIFNDITGEEYSDSFYEGINFHPGIVDMQHTIGSFDNTVHNFQVDMDNDGFADNDIDKNGRIDGSENTAMSLSNTAVDTSLYMNEYLNELGISMPVVDYSSQYKDFMDGSLFNADNLAGVYLRDSELFKYNHLQNELSAKTVAVGSDFDSFITKLQAEFSGIGGTTLDYMPNIYEIARKGISISDDTWTDKDVFYMSMLMLEARRRYTYSMASLFDVNNSNLDIKELVNTYANPDMWKYDEKENMLYVDVATKGSKKVMYNYFIPDDVGADIPENANTDETDPDSYLWQRKNAKCNWLKRRAIEVEIYNTALDSYQKNLQLSLEKYLPMIVDSNSQYKYLKGMVQGKIESDTQDILNEHYGLLNEMSNYLDVGSLDNYLATYYIESAEETKKRIAWEIYDNVDADYREGYFYAGIDTGITDYDTFSDLSPISISESYNLRMNDTIDNLRLLYSLIDNHTNEVLIKANDIFLNPLFGNGADSSFINDVNSVLNNACYDLHLDEMGDYGLESKEMIVNRVTTAITDMAEIHRDDIYSVAGEFEKVIGSNYSPKNMLAVLGNLTERSGRMFFDIKQVNDFNVNNYGNVNYVLDTERDRQNIAQYGISSLGYYPDYIAKSSFNSPYLTKNSRPLDLQGKDAITGTLSVGSNPLDKVYWNMIYQMQKASTFYMMQSFASPTNGYVDANGTWQLDSDLTDLNADGTVDYKDLSLNFMNPLETVYKEIVAEYKYFSSGDIYSNLNAASTKVEAAYVTDKLSGVSTANYYDYNDHIATYEDFEIQDVEDIKSLIKNYVDCKLDDDDFEETGAVVNGMNVVKINQDGLDKIEANHPIGDNFTGTLPSGDPITVFSYLKIAWDQVPTQLVAADGTIALNLFEVKTADITFSKYNPFPISYYSYYRIANNHYPGVLTGLGSADMLDIVQNIFNENGSTKANIEAPDDDYSIGFDSDSKDKYTEVLVSAGVLVEDPVDSNDYRFTDTAITQFNNNDAAGITWLRTQIQTADTATDLFVDGTENIDSYWSPLFTHLRTEALYTIDFTGSSNSIMASMVPAFNKNKFTISNPDYYKGSDLDKTITVSLQDAPDEWKTALSEYQTIYENSVKMDYEKISKFLLDFNKRMETIDFDGTAYTGGNLKFYDESENVPKLNTILPEITRTTDTFTSDINFSAFQSVFSLTDIKQDITAADLDIIAGISGIDIHRALVQTSIVYGSSAGDLENQPIKMLTTQNFPPIYDSNENYKPLTAAQQDQIIAVFQEKYLGVNLKILYDSVENITLSSSNAGDLSLDVKEQVLRLLSDQKFIDTIEFLNWAFEANQSIDIENLSVLGNYFDSDANMAYSRGDTSKGFISVTPSDNYTIEELANSASSLRGEDSALKYLQNTKWLLTSANKFDFTTNSVSHHALTTLDDIDDTLAQSIIDKLTTDSHIDASGKISRNTDWEEASAYQLIRYKIRTALDSSAADSSDANVESVLGELYDDTATQADLATALNFSTSDALALMGYMRDQGVLDYENNQYERSAYYDWDGIENGDAIRTLITNELTPAPVGYTGTIKDLMNSVLDKLPLPFPTAEYTAMMNSFASYSSQFHPRAFRVPTDPGDLINFEQYLNYVALNNSTTNAKLQTDLTFLKDNLFEKMANNSMAWTTSTVGIPDTATFNIGQLATSMDSANVFEGYKMTTTYNASDSWVDPAVNPGDSTTAHSKTWTRTYNIYLADDGVGNMVPKVETTDYYLYTTQVSYYKEDPPDVPSDPPDPLVYVVDYSDPVVTQDTYNETGVPVDGLATADAASYYCVATNDGDGISITDAGGQTFNIHWGSATGEITVDAYKDATPTFAAAKATDPTSWTTAVSVDYDTSNAYNAFSGSEVFLNKWSTGRLLTENTDTYTDNTVIAHDFALDPADGTILTSLEFKYYSNGDKRIFADNDGDGTGDDDGTYDYYDPMRSLQDEFQRDFAGLRFDSALDANYISNVDDIKDDLVSMGIGPKLQGTIKFNDVFFNYVTVGTDDGPAGSKLTDDELTYLKDNGFIDEYGWCLKYINKPDDMFFPSDAAGRSARDIEIYNILYDKSKWFVTELTNTQHVNGGDSGTYNNQYVILHSRRTIDETEQNALIDLCGDDEEKAGIAELCFQQIPSIYDLVMYTKTQFDQITFPLETRFTKYSEYRRKIDKLLSIGNDGASSSTALVEQAFKDQYLNEFYMREDFTSLIMGSEFNSRYNYAAQIAGDFSGDIIAPGNQNAWYETRGRYTPYDSISSWSKKNQENPSARLMDFKNMDYSIETDYQTQMDRVTGSSTKVEIHKLSGRDKRARRQKLVEDFYGRVTSFNDMLSSTLPVDAFVNSDYREIIYKGDFMSVNEIQYDGTTERTENEKMILVNELIAALIAAGYLSEDLSSEYSADWVQTTGAYSVESSDGTNSYYDDFETFNIAGLPADLSSDRSRYQIFKILKSSMSYASRIGANMGFIHTGLEMNFFSNEESWARLMILNWNDLQSQYYEKQKEVYKEEKRKYEEQEYSKQVANAKAQQRKAYLKSLRNKR